MEFLWIGTAAFLIFFLQAVLYQKNWGKGLEAKIEFSPAIIWEGEEGQLKEVIQNRKGMPLPVLHVNLQSPKGLKFTSQENTAVSDQIYRRDIFSLLPYQQITRTLTFVGMKRGCYRYREVELVGRTLFFQGPLVKKQPQTVVLYVYPKAISMKPVKAACEEMLGEYLWKKKLFEDPFSFQGIRNYEPHDSFRQINWKAYGRTGQLKVNVFDHTAMVKADILLNLERDAIWTEEILPESVIRIGAAFAKQWISMGIPVRVRTNGREQGRESAVEVGFGAGPEHGETILKALSRIDLEEGVGMGAWRREAAIGSGNKQFLKNGQGEGNFSGMILYVSHSSRIEDIRCLEYLRQRGSQVLWICPFTQRQKEQKRLAAQTNNEKWESVYQGQKLDWRAEE